MKFNNTISEQMLFNYLKCPLIYDFAQKGIKSNTTSFNKLVYSVVKNLYLSTLEETYRSINPLQRKWDKIAPENNLNQKKALEGWGCIINAYNYITHSNIRFSDVDASYEIEIPGTKVLLRGQLDPFIDKGTHIEILISHFNKKHPEQGDINKRLKHTIDAYAIKQMYGKDVIIKYKNFVTGIETCTTRSTRDFNRLSLILKNVATALENDVFYPSETIICNNCDYVELCGKWGNDNGINS